MSTPSNNSETPSLNKGDNKGDKVEGNVSVATIESGVLFLKGDWTLSQPHAEIPTEPFQTVDLSGLKSWDSTLVALLHRFRSSENIFQLKSAPENLERLLQMASGKAPAVVDTRTPFKGVKKGQREKAGLWFAKVLESLTSAVSFLGEIFISIFRMARTKKHFRAQDWLRELHEAGGRALPIVTFLSFLVGMILAFVGAIQLKLFGASIYVANLVGVSMTREMGALVTAIVMAGRTGAAYAAQIGSMKRSEELDALRTMGLSPIDMVVLPKISALTIMVPLLSVFSVFAGMFAGLLVTSAAFGVSESQYIQATVDSVPPRHFAIGLVKALVYGFLVAYSGAWRGMRCGNSADAVGQAATSAVVMSLTLIVVADGIFAIILNAINL